MTLTVIGGKKFKAEFISFQKKYFLSAFCLLPFDENLCYLVVQTVVQSVVSLNKN